MEFKPKKLKTYKDKNGQIWISYFYPGGLGMLPFDDPAQIRACYETEWPPYSAEGMALNFLKDGLNFQEILNI